MNILGIKIKIIKVRIIYKLLMINIKIRPNKLIKKICCVILIKNSKNIKNKIKVACLAN